MYKATPDNREMGRAFGKKFDKKTSEMVKNLSSDAIRQFMASGSIKVGELTITSEMLKVTKNFNKEIESNKQFACASGDQVSLMLDTVQTESLIQHGLSREITNRIQRLRKTSGISIEDQIEIFYRYEGTASPDSAMGQVVRHHSDKIMQATKMPFHSYDKKADN